MILKLPINFDLENRYLSAEEIKALNEWCARLAQLQLLGATLEPHTEDVYGNGKRVSQTLGAVPVPFEEPPAVKCPNCGNDEIRKFVYAVYERRTRALFGFSKKGEVGVRDDSEWDDISPYDVNEAARPLAGAWLKCGSCAHEQPIPANLNFDF